MGTLTRSELEAEITSNLGERTDVSSRLPSILNIAQERIDRAHSFPELETSVELSSTASTKTLDLPTTPRDVISARLEDSSNSRKLAFIPPRRWDRFFPYPETYTEGRPSHYTVWGDTMELWRVPDDDYSILVRYISRPTAFSSGSDIASDFLGKDDIIIAFATGWLFRSLGSEDKARSWESQGMKALNIAIHEDKIRTDYSVSSETPDYSVGNYWAMPFVRNNP